MNSPAQTVGDLRTLVTRRVGVGRKVALLSGDGALALALEQNGCHLLVDPGTHEALVDFGPDVVVTFDGFANSGAEGFELLARTAPQAELVFSFSNAASASALVAALVGQAPPRGLAEREVRAWLTSVGYVVTTRDIVVMPHVPSELSSDTETSLRALFEQLNPDAAIDRLLLVARRGVAPSKPDRVAGQVSVIVSAGDDVAGLEGTLRSLAAQVFRPLEVVLVCAHSPEVVDRVVAPLRTRKGVFVVTVPSGASDAAVRTNAGLEAARGQYVAFVEAGDLVDVRHLVDLEMRLRQGTRAWALAAQLNGPFRLAAGLVSGAVNRARWLIDRDRLGAFSLTFPEGTSQFEAVLFTRLALLFAPVLGDAGSVDSQRDGGVDPRGLLDALGGRPMRGLVSLEALFERPTLSSLVQERLKTVRPGAGDALARALDVLRKTVGR